MVANQHLYSASDQFAAKTEEEADAAAAALLAELDLDDAKAAAGAGKKAKKKKKKEKKKSHLLLMMLIPEFQVGQSFLLLPVLLPVPLHVRAAGANVVQALLLRRVPQRVTPAEAAVSAVQDEGDATRRGRRRVRRRAGVEVQEDSHGGERGVREGGHTQVETQNA